MAWLDRFMDRLERVFWPTPAAGIAVSSLGIASAASCGFVGEYQSIPPPTDGTASSLSAGSNSELDTQWTHVFKNL